MSKPKPIRWTMEPCEGCGKPGHPEGQLCLSCWARTPEGRGEIEDHTGLDLPTVEEADRVAEALRQAASSIVGGLDNEFGLSDDEGDDENDDGGDALESVANTTQLIATDHRRECGRCGQPSRIELRSDGGLSWMCDEKHGQALIAAIELLDVAIVVDAALAKHTPEVPPPSWRSFDFPNPTDGISHRQRLTDAVVNILEQLAQQPRPRANPGPFVTRDEWETEGKVWVSGWFDVRGDLPDWLGAVGEISIPVYVAPCSCCATGSIPHVRPCQMPMIDIVHTRDHDDEDGGGTLVLARVHCTILDRLCLDEHGSLHNQPSSE